MFLKKTHVKVSFVKIDVKIQKYACVYVWWKRTTIPLKMWFLRFSSPWKRCMKQWVNGLSMYAYFIFIWIENQYKSELDEFQYFIRKKIIYGKTPVRRTYFTAKFPCGEITVRRNFVTAKFSYCEISYGEISYGQISCRERIKPSRLVFSLAYSIKHVSPLFLKSGRRKDPNIYRPISLLPVLEKSLRKVSTIKCTAILNTSVH